MPEKKMAQMIYKYEIIVYGQIFFTGTFFLSGKILFRAEKTKKCLNHDYHDYRITMIKRLEGLKGYRDYHNDTANSFETNKIQCRKFFNPGNPVIM